jgi:hypothetical protein
MYRSLCPVIFDCRYCLSRTVKTILHSFQDHLLRLFQSSGATADLNRLAGSLLLGHVDAAAGLLADAVDLAATLADDESIGLGVGQDQEACGGLLRGAGEGFLDGGAGLGHVLWGAGEDPGEGSGGGIGGGVVDDCPGVGVCADGGVIGDQGHVGAVGGAMGFLGWGDGWHDLASVVDGDLVVIAQAAEEGAVVGDGVVQVAGDFDRLGVLLLEHRQEVLLGALDGSAGPLELNIGATGALLGDVQGDVELGLDAATGITTAADEKAVLSGGDVENLSDLVLALLDKLLDRGDDAVHDLTVTLKTDGRLSALGLGETDHSGGTAVSRASSLSHDLADVGT